MSAEWNPMRWPKVWKDPSALSLLKGSAIDCLVCDTNEELEPLRSAARKEGFQVVEAGTAPPGVSIVEGEWPGVQLSRGAGAQADAGPTGVPWVDTNGWKVRLAAATHPRTAIWVNAAPKAGARLSPDVFLVGVADSAAYGGRWIVSLPDQVAEGILAGKSQAQGVWKQVVDASRFFAARKAWASYVPQAVVGVVSDFSGPNEFLSNELLNLIGRTGEQYRIILKSEISDAALRGLRAVIYVDGAQPAPALRKLILSFVTAGGMLITAPCWGPAPGTPATAEEHPRFKLRVLGKGRVAVANEEPDDAYVLAGDAVILVSHRYDLVRVWNGGALAAYYTKAPEGGQALVHLLFFANRAPDMASVWVAGRYRSAKMWTVDRSEPRAVDMESRGDAVEVFLPPASQYVALQLDV